MLSDPFPSLLALRQRVLPLPAYLDTVVFGAPGSGNLQAGWKREPYSGEHGPFRECPCGVTWRGDGGCWACEEPG